HRSLSLLPDRHGRKADGDPNSRLPKSRISLHRFASRYRREIGQGSHNLSTALPQLSEFPQQTLGTTRSKVAPAASPACPRVKDSSFARCSRIISGSRCFATENTVVLKDFKIGFPLILNRAKYVPAGR